MVFRRKAAGKKSFYKFSIIVCQDFPAVFPGFGIMSPEPIEKPTGVVPVGMLREGPWPGNGKLEFVGQSHLPLPLGEVPPQGAERALSVTAKAVPAPPEGEPRNR